MSASTQSDRIAKIRADYAQGISNDDPYDVIGVLLAALSESALDQQEIEGLRMFCTRLQYRIEDAIRYVDTLRVSGIGDISDWFTALNRVPDLLRGAAEQR